MVNKSRSDGGIKSRLCDIRKIFSKLNSVGKIKLIIALACFIVLLFIFSSSFVKPSSFGKTSNTIVEASSYVEKTEFRLQSLLSSVKGLSNVKVFVYVKSTEEIVYLKDKVNNDNNVKDDSSMKEVTIFNKDGSSSTAVVVLTKYPTIEGILIVANGVNDIKLKLKIIDAVSCVLSIAPKNIEVLEGKS